MEPDKDNKTKISFVPVIIMGILVFLLSYIIHIGLVGSINLALVGAAYTLGLSWLFKQKLPFKYSYFAFNIFKYIYSFIVVLSVFATIFALKDSMDGLIGLIIIFGPFYGFCLSVLIFVLVWAFEAYFNSQKEK